MAQARARRSPCRVLLVDQDLSLNALARPLFESAALVPVGQGCSYREMLAATRAQSPEVIVVDIPSGARAVEAFAAIEAVMAERPTPILVLYPSSGKRADVFRALDLGALDLAERPDTALPSFWHELGRRLELLSQVRVVQHVKGKRRRRAAEEPGRLAFPLVAIAASLGGPKALSSVLRMLPRRFPAPICICQHISSGFTGGLAQWLSYETSLKVVEGKEGDPLRPGTVYIAPSGAHLLVSSDGKVKLDHGPPHAGFKPSCDLLLMSAADAFGSRAIGVILTGMGRDGARGLMEIRSKGGRTIAQDEASCVVFGMPREAIELGAAEEVLPLDEIAGTLIRWVEQC